MKKIIPILFISLLLGQETIDRDPIFIPGEEYKSGAFSKTITQDNKIGFRVPNYPFLIKLLSSYKKPITTTSINTTGQEPLNNPDEIEEIFGNDIDLILDAGKIKNSNASKIYIFDQNNISQIR